MRPRKNDLSLRAASVLSNFTSRCLANEVTFSLGATKLGAEAQLPAIALRLKRGKSTWTRHYYDLTSLTDDIVKGMGWPEDCPQTIREKA